MDSRPPPNVLPLTHAPENGRRLILSVDDEPAILYTRQILLKAEGYEVLSAADGQQALNFLASHPIDLVLLDYLMPGMDGGVVAQKIKQSNRRVAVVMVSAGLVPEDALNCADALVTKGQSPAVLLQKIRELLADQ